MEEQVSNLLVFFFTGYLLFTIISYIVWRQLKMLIFEVSIGIVALAVLYFTTGFPFERTVAFGGFNPYLLTLLLLFFIVVGMMANYIFYKRPRQKFRWLLFFKPFFISPIVLLPLIGAINFDSIEHVQLISLCFLAFQNGFFWREIFNKALKQQQEGL